MWCLINWFLLRFIPMFGSIAVIYKILVTEWVSCIVIPNPKKERRSDKSACAWQWYENCLWGLSNSGT